MRQVVLYPGESRLSGPAGCGSPRLPPIRATRLPEGARPTPDYEDAVSAAADRSD